MFFSFYQTGNGNCSNKDVTGRHQTQWKQADIKPTNEELQLELLRLQYQSLAKKNRQDRDRLNAIKRGLEKAYTDLEELREMTSSDNSRQ